MQQSTLMKYKLRREIMATLADSTSIALQKSKGLIMQQSTLIKYKLRREIMATLAHSTSFVLQKSKGLMVVGTSQIPSFFNCAPSTKKPRFVFIIGSQRDFPPHGLVLLSTEIQKCCRSS